MHTLHMYTGEQAHRLPKREYPFDLRKGHILSWQSPQHPASDSLCSGHTRSYLRKTFMAEGKRV